MLRNEDVRWVLHDLIAAGLCASRGDLRLSWRWPAVDGQHWLDDRGLALDSIELMDLSAEVMQLFQLDDTPIGDGLLIERSLDGWCRRVSRHAAGQGLTLRTSGTTGDPKGIEHSLAQLRDEADFFAAQIPFERVIAMVPCHHIYGLIWTRLLPETAKVEVLSLNQSLPLVRTGLEPGDLVVASPTWWSYLLKIGARLSPCVVGVSSTEPMPQAMKRELYAAGLQDLYEIYGSSETGGIGYRHGDAQRYQLLPRWDWQDGPRPCLIQRVDGHEYPALDRLTFANRREFSVGPRLDGQVQICGNNVDPHAISARLGAYPGVVRACVRSNAASTKLIADVELEAPLIESEQQAFEGWIRQEFRSFERPSLRFV